jgi:hypothetical protein
LLCAAALTLAQRAEAQDAPAAPPPAAAAPTDAAVPPPAPAPESATPAEAAPVVAPTPTVTEPPPPVEAPPAEEPPPAPEQPGPLTIGAWLHTGTMMRSYKNPEKLDRLSQDGEVDIVMSAQLTKGFGITTNFAAVWGPTLTTDEDGVTTFGGNIAGSLAIMDAHAKIGIDDAFNIWVGRMLVPSDRSNFSGYWFAAPWTYPGKYDYFGAPVGPRQGPFGRNDGVTLWGQVAGGMFKYYAGAYDLHNGDGTALMSGRLNLSLINPEPGYYHSSTYYGGKDLLAIGIGGQYQKDGSGGTDDYSELNADVLFEKNFGSGGVLDLEGAFYKYMGDAEAIDYSYMLVASWLTPEPIGVGKLQPLIRLQQAKRTDTTVAPEETDMLLDFQLGYVVADYATRFALVYQRSKYLTVDGNAITLGIQVQR